MTNDDTAGVLTADTESGEPDSDASPRRWRKWWVVTVFVVVVGCLLVAHQVWADRIYKPARSDGGVIAVIDGPDLHYEERGPVDAPVVVLLHGWTGSLRSFEDVDVPNYRVIAVDLPGCGGSEGYVDGYAIPEQALQVGRLLDSLKVRSAIVVGHSMGGDVAVALWEQRPEVVADLVLVDTPPDIRHTHPSLLVRSTLWPVVGAIGHLYAPEVLERTALQIAVAPGAAVSDRMVEDLDRSSWPAYRQGYSETYAWLAQGAVPQRLRSFQGRLLVVWGNLDQLVDPDAALEYRAVPAAEIEYLDGAGHTPMVEDPGTFNRILDDFVQRRS